MADFLFRQATSADADAVVALVNSAYRGETSRAGWTTEADLLDGVRTIPAEIRELILQNDSCILLCVEKDALLASVHLEKKNEAAHLGMFSVRPSLQANGIGKALMRTAERWVMDEWNCRKMIMHVVSVREELIAFYERRGYRLTGVTMPFPVNPALWTPKVAELRLAEMVKPLG